MNPTTSDLVYSLCQIPPRLNVWQWAEQNIDYSRAPAYDSEWKGPYRADYMPYLREPLEAATNPAIKEIWMLACTRGGKSENLLLTVMRYMLACAPPYAMLYIGGQQEKVEQFYQKRIIRGMELSEATARLARAAVFREHTAEFGGACDLIVSWAANKQVSKGDSYPVIFADEVSSWPGFKADALRERQANVNFGKIIGVSSPDAESRRSSDEDPIFQEFEATDCRQWFMPCPKTGEGFQWRMGSPDTPDGVKWDARAKRDDGTWDLEMVEATAHYITPGGARIDEADRIAITAAGAWKPTAKGPPWKWGGRVTRFMTPFQTGGFGNMARAFLEATRKQRAGQFDEDGRPPLRVFVYERLAEKYYAEKRVPEQSELENRKGQYAKGKSMAASDAYKPVYIGKRFINLLTVDVQQREEWWIVREHLDGGDSGMIDCGCAGPLPELREIGLRHHVRGVLIDNSYSERRNEMVEAVASGVLKGGVLCYGRDALKEARTGQPQDYVVSLNKDPYEGTAKQGRVHITSVTFHPDRIKNQLYSLTLGGDWHAWRIPHDAPPWYFMHMTAEECIDGRWTAKRRDNHGWDCEVMQLLGAKLFGMWRDSQPALDVPAVPPAPNSAPAQPKPQPVAKPAKAEPDPRAIYEQMDDDDDE